MCPSRRDFVRKYSFYEKLRSKIGEIKTKRGILVLLLIPLFFILGHDWIHHWDEGYYLYDAAFTEPSEWGVFSMFKFGHLLLLKGLIKLTGIGLKGLFFISLAYALVILCFVFCSFFLLREIFAEEAVYVTIILMLLPLTLYLAFKALAEVPSILFGAFSLLSFLYALKSNGARKLFFILASGSFLSLSTLCRFEAPIMFLSFFFALLMVYRKEYGTKKLFSSFFLTSMVSLAFVLIAIAITNIDIQGMSTYLFSFQEKTRYTFFENFLMFSLEGGLFYPFALFSIFNRKKEIKFALIWFIFASIIPTFFMDHVEARRLCWNMIPLSILIFMGIKDVFKRLKEEEIKPNITKIILVSLFCVILVGNQFLVVSGPDKIDEKAYSHLFEKIDGLYKNRTILVSDSSDHDFIKFTFPIENVLYVRGERGKEEVMKLLEHNKTILYVTWNINRDYFVYKYERSNYNESWIAKDQRIILKKVIEEERYETYLAISNYESLNVKSS